MGEEVSGDNLDREFKGAAAYLNPALLGRLPHVVRAQHHPHGGGPIGAVGSSQDPLVGNDCATAKPLLIDKESGHPREGVRGGLIASHDPRTPLNSWNSTLPGHALSSFLIA